MAHPRSCVSVALFVICGVASAQRITLTGNIHPKATAANDRGRVAPSLDLSWVTLTLTQSAAQQADLTHLLAEQQNPSSPDYHRWLTPGQYADRFGVSPEDVRSITQWLQGQGLSIAAVAQGRNWIAVNGSAAQIESAFGTEIHQYAVDGETHFANATNPSVPAAIGGMVLSIRGLNDFRMKPHIQKPEYTHSGSGNHYLAPDDLATIYDILPAYAAGIDGSGQRLVVAGQSLVDLSDIQQFRASYNLPANVPQTLLVPGSRKVNSNDLAEADLDIEWTGAVARNATIVYVYSDDVMTSVQWAIDQKLAPVISVSYGACEQETPSISSLRSLAQEGNLYGITWLDASGDNGATDCDDSENPGLAVDAPASFPEVTGVGGTTFVEGAGTYWNATNNANGASVLSYIPETSWNDPPTSQYAISASGGGVSVYFPKPAWQVGPGVPGNNSRNVPDVAFSASAQHDGYLIYSDGAIGVIGGTSASTPVMAGITALLNQYLGANGQGNINPWLYSLAQSNPAVFRDITTGNNIPQSGSSQVGYYAGVGYDNVTGLGSIDAWRMLTCWSGTCSAGTTPPTQPPAAASLSLIGNVSTVSSQNSAFLTATATASDGVTTPQGVVLFTASDGTSLGAVTLVGSAGISTATLVVQGGQLPSGSTTVTATYNGSSTSAPVTSSVLLSRAVSTSSNGTPEIPSNGLADGASFQPKYSPGMILSVFGAALSPAGTAESAGSVPLPVTMAGVSATVNGVEAPLYYVSPNQVNLQVPWQTAVNSPATLLIDNNGQVASQTFYVGPASPGIFTDQALTIVPNGTAAPGQITTLYLAGAGAVTPAIATGSAPAASTPLSSLPAPVKTTVTVGGAAASTSFIGIPYGLVGVTQINFQVPGGIPAGRQPVVVSVNGVASSAAYLSVTN